MEKRGVAARFGVVLLNLIAAGLGLLRIGRLRRAALLFTIWVAVYLFLVAAFAANRNLSFPVYGAIVGTFVIVVIVVELLSLWWTWTGSRHLLARRPTWARWYSVVAAGMVAIIVSWLLTHVAQALYHNFYVPSEAMEPTFYKNDQFVASMRTPEDLRRGDVVLVRTDVGTIYVKRIAALAGDKIAMRNGFVIINGRLAATAPAGTRRVSYPYLEATTARLYAERLPGERTSHIVQDLGPSTEDNISEIQIPAGHVFVLGDNRDNSADSRVPKSMGGLEFVPLHNLVGRPLFFYWPRKKMGQTVMGSAL